MFAFKYFEKRPEKLCVPFLLLPLIKSDFSETYMKNRSGSKLNKSLNVEFHHIINLDTNCFDSICVQSYVQNLNTTYICMVKKLLILNSYVKSSLGTFIDHKRYRMVDRR